MMASTDRWHNLADEGEECSKGAASQPGFVGDFGVYGHGYRIPVGN